MIGRAALLSCTLLLAGVDSANAQKLVPPIGDWTRSAVSAMACQRLELTIERDRLIQCIDREGVRGEAWSEIHNINNKTNEFLFVDTKYDWDKHISQVTRETPDNEYQGSFSVTVGKQGKILFYHINYRLCPLISEAVR